jgi:CHAD domain-containing protein
MFCLELSVLLHRALETRVETLMNELARPGWQDLPDALHDVRVASRRVRTVLSLVQPGLYPGHKRQTRNLKRLTRALGRPREMDVHAAILEDLARRAPDLAAAPAREHLLEVLERRLGKARRAMARALERINLKRLPHLLQVPSLPDPFRHEEDLGPATWACLAPWLEGAFPGEPLLDQDDAGALHALRIRVKRLRYALEVLGTGFPVPPEGELKHLHNLQMALGNHHDLATLQAWLERLHRGLAARERPILAEGTRAFLDYLGEERLIAYEHFRALALAMPEAAFVAGLRRNLGVPAPEPGSP